MIKKKAPKVNPAAVKQYLDFHGKQSAKLLTANIEMPDEKTPLIFIGKAPEVIYLSDKKDGKTRLYKHTVKKHGNIFAVIGNDKRVKTIIISNLNMRIDKRGLIG